MSDALSPALYGIENSNRSSENLWGKNQFNSTFPISLCCYMRDQNVPPVYVSVTAQHDISASDQSIRVEDIFGTPDTGGNVRFEFETLYKPYQDFSSSPIRLIDVVIKDRNGNYCRPIEVKLTVIPDSTTINADERLWSTEIVIRPVSSAYAVMSLWESIRGNVPAREQIKAALDSVCQNMQSWDHKQEIISKRQQITSALKQALQLLQPHQRPYLIQPIWKTKGKKAELANQCLDVFCWSDLAVVKLPLMSLSKNETSSDIERQPKNVSRALREVARHVRCLYMLCTADRFNYNQIYAGMSLGSQTDKAFSISGSKSILYLLHRRLERPQFPPVVLSKLILNGGEGKLSPERRFDAIIFYTCRDLAQSAE